MKAHFRDFLVPTRTYTKSGRVSRKIAYKKAHGLLFELKLGDAPIHIVVQTMFEGEDLPVKKIVHFESGYIIAQSTEWAKIEYMLEKGTSAPPMSERQAVVKTIAQAVSRVGKDKFLEILSKQKAINTLN